MSKKTQARIPNVHPGDVLLEDFLKPMEISQYRLAKEIGVSESTVSDVVNGRRGVTADIALRLARYFGVSAQFWLNLQEMYDIEEVERKVGKQIEKIRPHRAAA
jgi:addiction module HigA family antidote